ncbi:B12-dependent methionine synthase [Pelomyxa schiedti]|nr:B12-dependent methionine synthase [Pelomyxa schiedti]
METKIVVLDGAMGTQLGSLNLTETDYRGNFDVLNLTRPDIVKMCHMKYLLAGADIITTNTFNSTHVAQKHYSISPDVAQSMAHMGAKLAVECAQSVRSSGKVAFVAGSLGPTPVSVSIVMGPDQPYNRSATFALLADSYQREADVLIQAGVDIILIETVFDTLNCKATISVALDSVSGRTMSGQNIQAFWASIEHSMPFCIGLNCCLPAKELALHLRTLSRIAPCCIGAYPNTGESCLGKTESPEEFSNLMGHLCCEGLLNIVGGCCGSSFIHISELAKAVSTITPRHTPPRSSHLWLSGLDVTLLDHSSFIKIGEQCNVYGSRFFSQLIKQNKFEEAACVARSQIQSGAEMIDINTDDALSDSVGKMSAFINQLSSDPAIAKYPFVIDSADIAVVEAGLQRIQGKGIVNSLSLKDGEDIFLQKAKLCREYGASIIVMACDETGPAETAERKVEICRRSARLLAHIGVPLHEIIFDMNVMTLASGTRTNNAVEFFEALKGLKREFPLSYTIGGVSNISYPFRALPSLRQAITSVFLFHAIKAGLDMAIMNVTSATDFNSIPQEQRLLIEKLIFDQNSSEDTAETLIHHAQHHSPSHLPILLQSPSIPASDRLTLAIAKGDITCLKSDLEEALQHNTASQILEGPLLSGLVQVGSLFGDGVIFLPHLLRASRVMHQAVEILKTTTAQFEFQKPRGTIILATVKGDVHDIGKCIVGTVMACSNFKVVDLGTQCEASTIVSQACEQKADFIGVSGLISPSLFQMELLAQELARRKFHIPLLIGGAATSELHTAVKLAPLYAPLIHIRDASLCVPIVSTLMNPQTRLHLLDTIKSKQQTLQKAYATSRNSLEVLPFQQAREAKLILDWSRSQPRMHFTGIEIMRDYDVSQGTAPTNKYPDILCDQKVGGDARAVFDCAQTLLLRCEEQNIIPLHAVLGLFPANSVEEDVEIYDDESRAKPKCVFHGLRQQTHSNEHCLALGDFIAPKGSGILDYIGVFAATAGTKMEALVTQLNSEGDTESSLVAEALSHRLVEALMETVHHNFLQYCNLPKGIRPAFGFPQLPDHSEKEAALALLDAERAIGVHLIPGSYAMSPCASSCGMFLLHPEAEYFGVGCIGEDQLQHYAKRKGVVPSALKSVLACAVVD